VVLNASLITLHTFRFGARYVVVPVRWQEGLRCVLLTASARSRLRVPGVNPCARGPLLLDSKWGLPRESIPGAAHW
jgi:hypothetical protein